MNGFIRQTFLEGEVEDGLTEIAQLTGNLTDEANSIMNEVADIVALPHLNDSDVQEGIRDARRKRDHTVAELYEFDAEQTRALMTIGNDLVTMTTWISDIEGLFTGGMTDIDFPMDRWSALSAENTLQTDLAHRTASVEVDGQPGPLLGAADVGEGILGYQFQEGVNGASIYTFPGMAIWARPIDGFNKGYVMYNQKVYPNSKLNPLMKSLNSFKEIGTDFVEGVNTRTDKALDSPSDFANYATLGISGGVISGAKSRTGKMWNSAFDFTNYWTMGLAGMVKGAFTPEDPFSKEHWMDSFGVATTAIGGVKAVAPKESLGTIGSKGTGNSPVTSKPLKGTNRAEGISRIEYLHNRYGKLTKEQLNQRINLRGETISTLQKLQASGLGKNKIGPALAGVYDKTTGRYYYAINDFNGDVPRLVPTLQSKYNSMSQEVIASYEFTKGAGSHAEVIALNDALKANLTANPNDFIVNVIRTGQNKNNPAGMMFPTCPHCSYLTEGFEFISEVPNIGE